MIHFTHSLANVFQNALEDCVAGEHINTQETFLTLSTFHPEPFMNTCKCIGSVQKYQDQFSLIKYIAVQFVMYEILLFYWLCRIN